MAFCTECGAELPEGAKFCHSCGTKVIGSVEPSSNEVPEKQNHTGTIRVHRRADFNTGSFDCTVTVDDGQTKNVADGSEITIETTEGNHSVIVRSAVFGYRPYSVYVPANGVVSVSFSLGERLYSKKESTSETKDKGSSNDKDNSKCPECGGQLVFSATEVNEGIGCGGILVVVILTLILLAISPVLGIIGGVIGIVLLANGSKKTVTYGVCQKCGSRYRRY